MAVPSRLQRCAGAARCAGRGRKSSRRQHASCAAAAAPIPVPPPVISACRPASQLSSAMLPSSIPHWPKASGVARRGKSTKGKTTAMKTRAAVAFEAKQPLEIVEVDLEGPKAGEVLVEIMATGICHTDAYTLDGLDSEGLFPSILGHEGAGVVREVGPGVTSVKPGDHVIPLYTPECRQCKSCLSRQDQPLHRDPRHPGQGRDARRHQPLLLQGRDRSSITWAARPSRTSPCCPRSRWRRSARTRRSRPAATSAAASPPASARWSTPPRSRPGANVVVFGLGGIGLNVIQGARLVGRRQDRRRRHQPGARGMGPQVRHDRLRQRPGKDRAATIVAEVVELTDGGADYTFDAPATPR